MTRIRWVIVSMPPLMLMPFAGHAQVKDCSGTTWRGVMVPAKEPGPPMVLSGVVYQKDRWTPAQDVILEIYHTDSTGVYNRDPDPANAENNPRLKCSLKTDSQGRYEVRTVRPGAYPGGRGPAHIHIRVRAKGHAEALVTLTFSGDRALTPEDYRRHGSDSLFSTIRPVVRDSAGVFRVRKDIQLGAGRR
jgi:protocatechuate 3,4-dioxygenase, beta subunit